MSVSVVTFIRGHCVVVVATGLRGSEGGVVSVVIVLLVGHDDQSFWKDDVVALVSFLEETGEQ